jgi:hypothetical protein
VLLLPDTAYVREGIEIGKEGKKVDLGEHAGQISGVGASHKTTCDAQGNFEFAGLPGAEWILTTAATWSVGDESQGGTMVRDVDTRQGDVKVILTADDLVRR